MFACRQLMGDGSSFMPFEPGANHCPRIDLGGSHSAVMLCCCLGHLDMLSGIHCSPARTQMARRPLQHRCREIKQIHRRSSFERQLHMNTEDWLTFQACLYDAAGGRLQKTLLADVTN